MHSKAIVGTWCILLALQSLSYGQAGNKYAETGKPCPEILLNNIQYWTKSSTRVSDLMGRWIVLDFWHKYCSSCVASFPHTDSMREKFKDSVQYFLIGMEDKEGKIREMYERFRVKQHLKMAAVFDSSLFKQLDISACPYIVVIDPQGIVRAVTVALSEQSLNALVHQEQPILQKAFRDSEKPDFNYNPLLPFLVNNNGGADSSFMYRSMLSKWENNMPDYCPESIEKTLRTNNRKFESIRADLMELYNYAYFGCSRWMFGEDSLYENCRMMAVFEVTKNKRPMEDIYYSYSDTYCYSLVKSSPLTVAEVQQIMQQDLKRTFGYSVTLESRVLPYWALVRTDVPQKKYLSLYTKLRDAKKYQKDLTHGQEQGDLNYHTELVVSDEPINRILYAIWSYHQTEPPFFDETGITQKISIQQDVLLTDIEDIRRALQLYGLDLVQKQKLMKVLVIRDPD